MTQIIDRIAYNKKIKHLQNILDNKKCFKLICGAGNQNLEEVSKLVAVYAKAGCHFFDLSADEKVLQAAQKGLDFAVPKEEQNEYHFCLSIGTKGDEHVQKAFIASENCTNCGVCFEICPQNAIKKNEIILKPEIITKNCIGCKKCQAVCPNNAISFKQMKIDDKYLQLTKKYSISCIELHASDTDEAEVDEIWDNLNKNFCGILSLCISRKKLSDEKILARVRKLVGERAPYTTIIQADGNPMSGGKDDFETTKAAVETGKLIQSLELPVYLLLSGGTNSKTSELARMEKVNINGVAIGSFGRKLIKTDIESDDFLINTVNFKYAIKRAENFIKQIYNYL